MSEPSPPISTDLETPQAIAADIAREYREDATRWTQGDWSRDRDGNGRGSNSPDAVCWCLRGAIMKRKPDVLLATRTYLTFDAALGHTRDPNDPEDTHLYFVAWNDKPGRTVAEVIELCNKVAAL